MITDAQNRPSNAQSLAAAGTIVSTDSIDLLTANRNVGRGFPMRVVAVLNTTLTGATAIQAQLISSANANLSTPTVLATGPSVAVAAALAGTRILDVPIPGTTQRYLGTQYIMTGTGSGGTVTSAVVAESDNATYPTMNTGL